MTDYTKLVKAFRIHTTVGLDCDECPYYDDCRINGDGEGKMIMDAAAAIEALQAQLPKRGEMKNADKIRAMSDEELARWVVDEGRYFGKEYEGYMSCLDWLKEEVQE